GGVDSSTIREPGVCCRGTTGGTRWSTLTGGAAAWRCPATPVVVNDPPARVRIPTMVGMNRADAYALLTEYTQNTSLIKHMLAVEAAMRAYARKLGEDEERWGIVGLLHDFDYERWPDPPDHPLKGSEILRQRGYPEDVIYAIKSHADYLPDCPRVHRLDKALYA